MRKSSLGDSIKGWDQGRSSRNDKKGEKSWGQNEDHERTKVRNRFW